jgi:hypothetical protein
MAITLIPGSHDVVNPSDPIDRNLMRMYVIVVVVVLVVLLVAGLLVLADRATEVVRRARKRRVTAERLAAAFARAEEKSRARDSAAEASGALTTVLPAILVDDHEPRNVALAGPAPVRHGGSGVSQSTDSGGSTIVAEAGRPCQGFGMAWTTPRLPMPLPPYPVASVLSTSRQRPASGSPSW